MFSGRHAQKEKGLTRPTRNSPTLFALAEAAEHVNNKHDDQDSSQADARPSAITPAAMPVISATAAQEQHQNDDQYQHIKSPFFK